MGCKQLLYAMQFLSGEEMKLVEKQLALIGPEEWEAHQEALREVIHLQNLHTEALSLALQEIRLLKNKLPQE